MVAEMVARTKVNTPAQNYFPQLQSTVSSLFPRPDPRSRAAPIDGYSVLFSSVDTIVPLYRPMRPA
jgi:hypothetical protein